MQLNLRTMFSKNLIFCVAVWLHRSNHLCWHHGPRRGEEKECGREGPWLLLLGKPSIHIQIIPETVIKLKEYSFVAV